MACEVALEKLGRCQCKAVPPDSILLGILSGEQESEARRLHTALRHRQQCRIPRVGGCPCEENRRVVLKAPEVACKRASEVLLKTVTFIRNLPSFYQLPPEDQVLLIHHCWGPLFVLGLAQEKVDFDVKGISVPSLLKKILLNQSVAESDVLRVTPLGAPLAEVETMKNFLSTVWSLNICAKEYAYLKGMVLFNPVPYYFFFASSPWALYFASEVCSLRFPGFVQTLRQEAQYTLVEFSSLTYSNNQVRLAWILGSLSILKTITAGTITELFFRPVSEEANVEELLLEKLCIK